jgi:hypothetical protein
MRTLGLISALLLCGLVGCKQGTGDRCQLDSDCSCSANNLTNKCVITQGIEGICCAGQSVFDSGPAVDANMSVVDSQTPDAQMSIDSGTD